MKLRVILFAAALLTFIAAHARADHAHADLLADTSAIQPAKSFWLGVRLTLDPGWHVYWKNPGDSGLPTRVKFTLPDGFTAGPLLYPTPRRFVLPGDITIFGYENSVILLSQITPPANLPPDFQGHFQAAVSWLVCADECIPGKDTVDLTLGAANSPEPANRELFDDCLSQLPVEAARDPDIANVATSAAASGLDISVTWKNSAPDQIDFLPDALDDFNIAQTEVKSSQNTTSIEFTATPLAGKTPGPTNLNAVIGYLNKDGKRRGAIISIALPAAVDNNH
jgi:DsbC/DsbD-like thiol-disulfide interchange protein